MATEVGDASQIICQLIKFVSKNFVSQHRLCRSSDIYNARYLRKRKEKHEEALFTVAVSCALISPAPAADLPTKTPPPPPVTLWTGCYGGAKERQLESESREVSLEAVRSDATIKMDSLLGASRVTLGTPLATIRGRVGLISGYGGSWWFYGTRCNR
jgi:hypothetical protein